VRAPYTPDNMTNIVIYSNNFGANAEIHWMLGDEEDFGPQLYQMDDMTTQCNGSSVGGIVNEQRNDDPNMPYAIDDEVYRIHQRSLHNLTHYVPSDPNNPVIDPLAEYFTLPYKNILWSNYYADLASFHSIIKADKTILLNVSAEQALFKYIIRAFVELDHHKIDVDSDIWWKDHKTLDGEITDNWKELWYSKFHDDMHRQFDTGKLKYMWQLNLLHWDLNDVVLGKQRIEDIQLIDWQDPERLFHDKRQEMNEMVLGMQATIETYKQHNVDHIVIDDPIWSIDLPSITKYLGMAQSDTLTLKRSRYELKYSDKKRIYELLFQKYI
jgi:hypothetical protein